MNGNKKIDRVEQNEYRISQDKRYKKHYGGDRLSGLLLRRCVDGLLGDRRCHDRSERKRYRGENQKNYDGYFRSFVFHFFAPIS